LMSALYRAGATDLIESTFNTIRGKPALQWRSAPSRRGYFACVKRTRSSRTRSSTLAQSPTRGWR
jgi:hypothetical protein